MSNLRMLINNLWDTATAQVTTGAALPTLGLGNSQEYGRSKNAAIVPVNGVSVITFDLQTYSYISGLVMYRHLLTNGATWRLELWAEAGQSGEKVYDSGTIETVETKNFEDWRFLEDPLIASLFDEWPFRFSHIWFNEVFALSGRITLVDAEVPGGLHEFNRIYLGSVLSPEYNMDYGHTHQLTNKEAAVETVGGNSYVSPKQSSRQFAFTLSWISDDEWPKFAAAVQEVTTSKDWFISLYPEDGTVRELQYAMACRFTSLPPTTHPHYNNQAIPMGVKEA